MQPALRISAVPADLVQVREGVAAVIRGRRAGAARILPLRLGRQLHVASELLAQPSRKTFCAHFPTRRCGPADRRPWSGLGFPPVTFSYCACVSSNLAQVKRPRERDLVLLLRGQILLQFRARSRDCPSRTRSGGNEHAFPFHGASPRSSVSVGSRWARFA